MQQCFCTLFRSDFARRYCCRNPFPPRTPCCGSAPVTSQSRAKPIAPLCSVRLNNLLRIHKREIHQTGINIGAVRTYGKQLLAALKHMASRNLVHADIKPDNILVDQGFGSLKLADFG